MNADRDRGRVVWSSHAGQASPALPATLRVQPQVQLPTVRAGLAPWARGRVSRAETRTDGSIWWGCCHQRWHPAGRWDGGAPGILDGSACGCACGCCTPSGKPRPAAAAAAARFDQLFRDPGPEAPKGDDVAAAKKKNAQAKGWTSRKKCKVCGKPKGRAPWPSEDTCFRHAEATAGKQLTAITKASAGPSRNGTAHGEVLVPMPLSSRAKGAQAPMEALVQRVVKAMRKGLAVQTTAAVSNGSYYRVGAAWAKQNGLRLRFHITRGKGKQRVLWATLAEPAQGRGK